MTSSDIKAIRLKLGLSQSALAEQLGVSQEAVSQWESGKKQMSKTAELLLTTIRKPVRIRRR